MANIVDEFQAALSGVKRVEHIVYPILQSDRPFLKTPDSENIEDLKVKQKQVSWLISQAKGQPDKILKEMQKYLRYYSLESTDMLREMKIRCYEEAKEREEEEARQDQIKKMSLKPEKNLLNNDDDFNSEMSESESVKKHREELKKQEEAKNSKTPEEIFEEGVAKTEITQECYQDKLEELNDVYWKVLNYSNTLDFGII